MANQPVQKQEFKVVLVGNGGTGKSTYIRKVLSDDFQKEYEPTIACEVSPADWETTAGPVRFFCWDTAGQEKFGLLRDAYYANADGAIVFYDVTSAVTLTDALTWIKDLLRVCGKDTPIAICANKVDQKFRVTKRAINRLLKELEQEGVPHVHLETSVLLGKNLLGPFEYLIKELMDGAELVYADPEDPAAPSSTSTPATAGQRDSARRNLLKRAAETPLPADR